MRNLIKKIIGLNERVQRIQQYDSIRHLIEAHKYDLDIISNENLLKEFTNSCFNTARKYEPVIIVKNNFLDLLDATVNIFINYFLYSLVDYTEFAYIFYKFYDYDKDIGKYTFSLHDALRYIEETMIET